MIQVELPFARAHARRAECRDSEPLLPQLREPRVSDELDAERGNLPQEYKVLSFAQRVSLVLCETASVIIAPKIFHHQQALPPLHHHR